MIFNRPWLVDLKKRVQADASIGTLNLECEIILEDGHKKPEKTLQR